jgi:hypothetical protein
MAKTQPTTTTTKTALIAHLTEATKETRVSYLYGDSKDVFGEIIEHLEYELSDDCDQPEAESALDDHDAPSLDTWAPYYRQRSAMVQALSNSEMNDCEDQLEEMYGKSIFDGCESFTDCEARIADAALGLGFNEAKSEIREAIEAFFESREA